MPPKRLSFVTGNKGKFEEFAHALAPLDINVAQAKVDVVEIQADTLEAVAQAKLTSAAEAVGGPVVVDDAGLFIDALQDFPGVYSAFALKTIGLTGILRLLEIEDDRRARFEAVIGYRDDTGEDHFFKGTCPGSISMSPRSGGHGFGFDPIFMPEGREETFAELPLDEKNRLSHRGKALAAFLAHLRGA